MADTGLRQLADRLTERYGTGKTIVDQVGDYYVSIYWRDYHADVFFSGDGRRILTEPVPAWPSGLHVGRH